MNSEVYAKGTCWNYWGCSEEKRKVCSAFNSGSKDECFIISKFLANGCRDIEDCYDCPWYKSYREE